MKPSKLYFFYERSNIYQQITDCLWIICKTAADFHELINLFLPVCLGRATSCYAAMVHRHSSQDGDRG